MIDWRELTSVVVDLDAAIACRDPIAHKLQLRSIWMFCRYVEDF